MPSLTRDARGRSPYWYACWTAPDGRQLKRSTKQRDRKKATEVLLTIVNAEGAIQSGSATEAQLRRIINDTLTRLGERKLSDPTVTELLDGWLAGKAGSASPATLRAYRQARDAFLEFLGVRANRSIRLLKKADIVAFRDQLSREGLQATTVNKLVKLYLPGPFETARKEGLLETNPFATVDALREHKVEKDRFSPEMVAALLCAARGTDWEGACLVGYSTGARLHDTANLRWSSIDTQNGLIDFVPEKTRKRVVVALHDDLRDYLAAQPAPEDPEAFCFPALANRPGGGSSGLSAEFAALMRRAGIAGRVLRDRAPGQRGRVVNSLTFHSFRHSAASVVFNTSVAREAARRVTAHASRGSLDRYLHQDVEAIRAAGALIPRLPKGE
jgi:integrase